MDSADWAPTEVEVFRYHALMAGSSIEVDTRRLAFLFAGATGLAAAVDYLNAQHGSNLILSFATGAVAYAGFFGLILAILWAIGSVRVPALRITVRSNAPDQPPTLRFRTRLRELGEISSPSLHFHKGILLTWLVARDECGEEYRLISTTRILSAAFFDESVWQIVRIMGCAPPAGIAPPSQPIALTVPRTGEPAAAATGRSVEYGYTGRKFAGLAMFACAWLVPVLAMKTHSTFNGMANMARVGFVSLGINILMNVKVDYGRIRIGITALTIDRPYQVRIVHRSHSSEVFLFQQGVMPPTPIRLWTWRLRPMPDHDRREFESAVLRFSAAANLRPTYVVDLTQTLQPPPATAGSYLREMTITPTGSRTEEVIKR